LGYAPAVSSGLEVALTSFPYRHRTLAEVAETEALQERSQRFRLQPWRLSPAEWSRLEDLTARERVNNPVRGDDSSRIA
jgi:hypothetical protein